MQTGFMRKSANGRRNQEPGLFYGGFLTNAVVTVSWQSGSIAVNERQSLLLLCM